MMLISSMNVPIEETSEFVAIWPFGSLLRFSQSIIPVKLILDQSRKKFEVEIILTEERQGVEWAKKGHA